tara:strand:+ start:188 stop:442 length:255 start_codon:yes stop_codon:yes gene_type:complete
MKNNHRPTTVTIPLHILLDLQWMARRYADGRSSYVTSLYNDHIQYLLEQEIDLASHSHETLWAKDGMGRLYDGLTDEQASEADK